MKKKIMTFYNKSTFRKQVKKIIIEWHRDIGYFLSGLIIIYSISGIALNHIDDFNPDFVIKRDTVKLAIPITKIQEKDIQYFSKLVGEKKIKIWDQPTPNQLKIYYDNASLHIYMDEKTGIYEKLHKRIPIYHTNLIHRNSIKGWKWVSDIFGILLIVLTITGMFILKGKYGFSKRGKWLVLMGFIPPILGILYFTFIQS